MTYHHVQFNSAKTAPPLSFLLPLPFLISPCQGTQQTVTSPETPVACPLPTITRGRSLRQHPEPRPKKAVCVPGAGRHAHWNPATRGPRKASRCTLSHRSQEGVSPGQDESPTKAQKSPLQGPEKSLHGATMLFPLLPAGFWAREEFLSPGHSRVPQPPCKVSICMSYHLQPSHPTIIPARLS